ncbi:MAG: serine hydrolase, partial [Chitinophagaceae bacterium]
MWQATESHEQMKKINFIKILISIFAFTISHLSFSQGPTNRIFDAEIKEMVEKLMKEGKIPGLSLVIIKDSEQVIKTFGYADLERKRPVTETTLLEIGSCTKAFTSLAAIMLEQQEKLDLDKPVSAYIPWFRTTYKGKPVNITIRNLLHHTSGIPWSTISKIPATNSIDALELTVRQLVGQELVDTPGKKYEYATINYDVLALVIQNVSKQAFEKFVQENIIDSLHLYNTTIGYPINESLKAKGYKIGFFKPREFDAPIFKGNNAAGYVISNAEDMAKWLKFQMGLSGNEKYELAKKTQQRDETVPPHSNASYGMGWEVSLRGDGEIFHSGNNPNFTSYVIFRPKNKIGIVVLANSNSSYPPVIANKIMKILSGEEMDKDYSPGDANDRAFSVASIVLAIYILITIAFIVFVIAGIINGKRKYERFSMVKLRNAALLLAAFLPVVYGIYMMPEAIYQFSWNSILVWTPVSFLCVLILILVAMLSSFLAYLLGLFFPEKNAFKRFAPRILLLSILSGLSNMVLVVLITSSLDSKVHIKYLVFYYLLSLLIYLSARRFVQVSLIKITNDAIYDLKEKIIKRIFATSYQKFEHIDRGRVYTTLNDDAGTIGESINMFVGLATSFFTAIGAFLYLTSIASWATMLALSLILVLVGLYYFVGRSTNKYYIESRDSKNVFMRLINGAIDGFKELTLHQKKKKEYMDDVFASANDFRVKTTIASIRFVNTSIFGESILIMILGSVTFAFPILFPDIKSYTLMSFLIVLLYLIG